MCIMRVFYKLRIFSDDDIGIDIVAVMHLIYMRISNLPVLIDCA